MPTPDTMTQWRPITTLWAICTRLSILVPSPITVSREAPRSIVVLAPISTSSWTITRPTCGTLRWLRAHGEAEPVLAEPRPGCRITRLPSSAWLQGGPGADRAVAADAHARADHRVGADHRAGADLGAGADHRAGIDRDPLLQPRLRMDVGARRDTAGAELRAGAQRVRMQSAEQRPRRPR